MSQSEISFSSTFFSEVPRFTLCKSHIEKHKNEYAVVGTFLGILAESGSVARCELWLTIMPAYPEHMSLLSIPISSYVHALTLFQGFHLIQIIFSLHCTVAVEQTLLFLSQPRSFPRSTSFLFEVLGDYLLIVLLILVVPCSYSSSLSMVQCGTGWC